ncbi:MAG: hypothetical protein QM718_10485 [Steroidobacteraceae bacterium]
MNSATARSRGPLIGLALLFMAPLAVSFWLYYGTSWRPAGQTNHGVLIEPPQPLPAISLAPLGGGAPGNPLNNGKWSLVYVGGGECAADCQQALVFARQVYLAMGRLADRVQRVFLATGSCCNESWLSAEQGGLITLPAAGAGELLARFPAQDQAHQLFVVDPLGNLMMSYDARTDPKGLREDLKKLLNLSHIG